MKTLAEDKILAENNGRAAVSVSGRGAQDKEKQMWEEGFGVVTAVRDGTA